MPDASIFAYFILYGWPVVMAVLFAKLDRHQAVAVSLILGYLFLPEQVAFDLPLLPALNKHTIPAFAALYFVLTAPKTADPTVLPGWIPRGLVPRLLLAILFVSSFLTVMTNSDPLFYGPLYLPALRPYDGLSVILALGATLIPFALARKYLAHPKHQKMLLAVFVVAAFAYSFLALYEVRMSPQMNNMVYGFFPHSFLQHIRAGGFRPLVFLNHGLWLAIFFATAIIAAICLSRAVEPSQRMKYLFLGGWVFLTLSLSNSLGALIFVFLFAPIALLLGARTLLMVSAVLAVTALLYPALRGAGWIPTEIMLDWAGGYSADRAQSLGYRFNNEDLLLTHAQDRLLFGWGAFGRNMVFADTGRPLTVTDGYWIIIIGQGGWLRYFAEFGLMCLPAVFAVKAVRKNQLGFETVGLILMLVINVLDLLPNATMTPLTWIMAGAVWGRLELGYVSSGAQAPATEDNAESGRRKVAYTRFRQRPANVVTKKSPSHQRYTRPPTT